MTDHKPYQTVIIGAGTIGTAMGHILAGASCGGVVLHTVEDEVAASVNSRHINEKYFPTFRLHPGLTATTGHEVLRGADVIFLAIPSLVIEPFLDQLKPFISRSAILVNLAKGFGCERRTVVECLHRRFPNPVATMKGPTFAREIINNIPTGFTLGYHDTEVTVPLMRLFRDTCVYLDQSTDMLGVEILSILKNMYAIVLGIIDAQYNSPNMRFLILTKAFREMRKVLLFYGGEEETLYRYCGYGDFTLTALNDLSRNRTLGLLIGKGFFTEQISHELVLEGKTAVQVFYEELSGRIDVASNFPIITELYKVLYQSKPVSAFAKTVLEVEED